MSTSDPNAPKFQASTPTSLGSMTRSAFFALTPHDQARAIREGWRIVDGPAQSKPVVITKTQFDAMPQAGRDLYLARGGTVADTQS